MPTPGHFEIISTDDATGARRGKLHTAHGVVDTPVFMPVGTQATVKGMSPVELEELGFRMVLSNTYHLNGRPGIEVIEKCGGLHAFMGWKHALLTDSGGYQVFSLAKRSDHTLTREEIEDEIAAFRETSIPPAAGGADE